MVAQPMYARPRKRHTNDEINASAEDCSRLQNRHEPSTSNRELPETKLGEAPKAREPAWEVLEAQSPDSLECYDCKRHHTLSDIQKLVAQSKDQPVTPYMKLDQDYYRTAKFIHPEFLFTAFRMVMKQHRLERDCTELLKLLSYRSGVLTKGTEVKRVVVTPKIVAGQLLMYSKLNRNVAWKIVHKFAALDSLPEGRQEILCSAECKICLTKFQVGLQYFEGEGTMLFITKWQNLGTGLSPMKSDRPCVIGPIPLPYLPFEGMGQREISESLQFDGQDLDSSSTLTSKEREDQFRKSESKDAQNRRARETLYWRFWGRQAYFVHEFAELGGKKWP